jgi:metallo-beta-lactamase class B
MMRYAASTALALAVFVVAPNTIDAQDSTLVRPYSEAECRLCAEWNLPHRPAHLFGNTYYVGTSGLAAVLIASPGGHVLIDAGLPDSAPHILSNIRALGFDPRDIRIILNSHAHFDHAGGIAAIQDVTGARVLVSASSARVLTTGRPDRDDPQHNVLPVMPQVSNVEIVQEQEVVRLGALELTMHPTPGHTPGGTSWAWRACEGARCLAFVYADSQTPISDDEFRYSSDPRYPSAVADLRRGQEILEQLRCDVLITPHPGASRFWERVRTAPGGLVDREACRRYVETARQQLTDRLAREKH